MFRLTIFSFSSVIFLAGGLNATPALTAVYNGASWLPTALPNSGVAQGAILTVIGTGLGPINLQQAQSYPLPTTQGLAGTSMQVEVGGVTETCIMIYTDATAAAAILPSATPVGTGTLTLSYQGLKSSIPIQVVAANVGTFTLNSGGTGPGVFTDTSYNAITMVHPANPGEVLVLWGSGLGAVNGDETEPPQQVDLGTGVQVLVENQAATVLYGGRGSSPGLDQINFVVPAGVSGCKVSVAVIVKGVTGNITTISVAPAGQATCGDTFDALSTTNLQKAVSSGSLNIGYVQLSRIAGGNDTLTSTFQSYPLNSLIRSYGGAPGPSEGNCIAYELSGSTLAFTDPVQPPFLDAGPQLALTGPAGSKTIPETSTGSYQATLATEPALYIEPGQYSVSNGIGGANVLPFSWSLTVPSYVTPTNIPASVNLSQNLTLTWTGGSAYSVASIILFNGVPLTSTLNSYVYALCTADATAGTFTVPSTIMGLFPPGGYGLPGKPGVDIQIAGIALNRFTVGGSPGIDSASFSVLVSNGGVATIQ